MKLRCLLVLVILASMMGLLAPAAEAAVASCSRGANAIGANILECRTIVTCADQCWYVGRVHVEGIGAVQGSIFGSGVDGFRSDGCMHPLGCEATITGRAGPELILICRVSGPAALVHMSCYVETHPFP